MLIWVDGWVCPLESSNDSNSCFGITSLDWRNYGTHPPCVCACVCWIRTTFCSSANICLYGSKTPFSTAGDGVYWFPCSLLTSMGNEMEFAPQWLVFASLRVCMCVCVCLFVWPADCMSKLVCISCGRDAFFLQVHCGNVPPLRLCVFDAWV